MKRILGFTAHHKLAWLGFAWWLLAAMTLFALPSTPPTITIQWETATEVETAGFYISRSHSATGAFSRLHKTLIPGKGDAFTGSSYQFIDQTVLAGTTYYYLLEEVELDTSVTRYANEIQVFKAPRFSLWGSVRTAVSILIGLILIISDIRKQNRRRR
ncbi:MAG: hypothetical protein GY943_35920 [Chloroflexi bacterium]|nr:hypothetical protein [Chloroflexota bacterium]